MKFPDILSILVVERGTQKGVPNVAFVLILKAFKNDYYIGPTITDDDGTCTFSRAACEDAISTAQSMFIMDYSGSLLDCKPLAELRMHSPEHIANMIRQFRSNPSFWGTPFKNPQEFFRSLEKTVNNAFKPFHTVIAENEILARPELKIELDRVENL
jgi:hypothetical protein